MALSFVPMSTSGLMVALRALVLLFSSPPTMPATLFSNSTAMTGKDVHSKFVRIDSLAPLLGLEAVADSAAAAGLVVDSAAVVGLEAVADSAVDSEAVAVDLEEGMEVPWVVDLMPVLELEQYRPRQTPSPTMLRQALKRTKLSMSEM